MPRHQSERRASQRFSIEREAVYRVLDDARFSGVARTVNISSAGILLATDQRLYPGMRIEVRIDWPAKIAHNIALQLVVHGFVTRLEAQGVALSILRYEFRTKVA